MIEKQAVDPGAMLCTAARDKDLGFHVTSAKFEREMVFSVFDPLDHVAVATKDLEQVRHPLDLLVVGVRASRNSAMSSALAIDMIKAEGSEIRESAPHAYKPLVASNDQHDPHPQSSTAAIGISGMTGLTPRAEAGFGGFVAEEGSHGKYLVALGAGLGVHLSNIRDLDDERTRV